jgi:hypothetical protein
LQARTYGSGRPSAVTADRRRRRNTRWSMYDVRWPMLDVRYSVLDIQHTMPDVRLFLWMFSLGARIPQSFTESVQNSPPSLIPGAQLMG